MNLETAIRLTDKDIFKKLRILDITFETHEDLNCLSKEEEKIRNELWDIYSLGRDIDLPKILYILGLDLCQKILKEHGGYDD